MTDESWMTTMDTSILARPTWVEIDLSAVTNNVNEFKRLVGEKVTILGVLKAHGYGHGLVPMAKHLVKLGVPILCAGSIYEAMQLRKAGITAPIQVFGSSLPESAKYFIDYDLMPTFLTPENPGEYMRIIGKNTPLKVWIKVDTGLGRLGVFPDQVEAMVREIQAQTAWKVEGVFSHIGARAQLGSDADHVYCERQWQSFKNMKEQLEARGIKIPYYQIASTHATMAYPHTWANCISIASGLYSSDGPADPKVHIKLQSAYLALRSKLISVKPFKAGNQIGGEVLQRDSLIGVAPIGLGDGFSGKNRDHHVLVSGVRCRMISPVSFEHLRLDVTDAPAVKAGDVVTIVGKDGNDAITIEELCQRTGVSKSQYWASINMTTVPYVFFENGKVVAVEIKA